MLALVHPIQHTSVESQAQSHSHRAQPSRSSRPSSRRPTQSHSHSASSSSVSATSPFLSSALAVSQPPARRSVTTASVVTPATSAPQPQPARRNVSQPTHTISSSSSSVLTAPPTVPVAPVPAPAPVMTPDAPPPRAGSPTPTLDIHSYPSQELLRLLASLLTHIASVNDALASPTSPAPPPPSSPHPPLWYSLTGASRHALASPAAPLTFHARNIPTITLEAYLLRILKYCPATNEVFLSLLVYFDRMAALSRGATGRNFVIDSYNVHRLVIAGVTVASKFFSDVFYTNSRYAKVGGLPQGELNQLELQFLLLNDFRLVISAEEMQHYAEQLIQYSAGETPAVAAPAPVPAPVPVPAYDRTLSTASSAYRSDDDAASIRTDTSGTDTDADTSGTDDEPTIRPAMSHKDSFGSDRASNAAELETGEGERTPERVFGTPRLEERMGSP